MAESEQEKIFRTKVVPIMNKVRNDLGAKQAEEYRKQNTSLSGHMMSMAGGMMVDGGMSIQQATDFRLQKTGKWNSKTTEDYVKMVKKELQRQHINVDAAMEKKMIDKMVKDNIPKSSIDYVVRRGGSKTIFYTPPKGLDKKITEQAEKQYNPTIKEKAAGEILGVVTDYASCPIPLKVNILKAFPAFGIPSLCYYMNHSDKEGNKKTGNQKTVKFVPLWMLTQAGINNYATSTQDQLKKAHDWAKKNADYYEKLIARLHSKNHHSYISKGDGKEHTIEEAEIRLKEYRLFAQKTSSALDLSQIRSELPVSVDKLKTANASQLAEANSFVVRKVKYYGKKFEDCVKNNRLTYKDADRQGGEHTYDEYDIRCRQYILYAEKVQAEMARREVARQKKAEADKPTVSESVNSSESASVNGATQSASDSAQSKSTTTNWNNFFSEQGLSVSGDIWNNLGYIFSMLPDLVVGMFTGKNKNMTFKNNLLPLSMIMMGMFSRRNPLLKIILMGFGGMMLFKNASKSIIGEAVGGQPSNKTYKSYADEPLDSRIKDVAVKGNSMMATIDGMPMVVTIESPSAIDAYNKGKLPLNTLANAVLKKYDSEHGNLANTYEQKINESEEQTRNIGIR